MHLFLIIISLKNFRVSRVVFFELMCDFSCLGVAPEIDFFNLFFFTYVLFLVVLLCEF